MKDKKICAVIPARGGSKGIKNKNLSKINGYTLVDIAIKEALKSKFISKVILTSDSKKILEIGRKYKQVILHKRSKELSNDQSKIVDVLLDLAKKEDLLDIIVLLQPTSPFRKYIDIDKCLKKMLEHDYKTAVSVKKLNSNPEWLFRINSNNQIKPIMRNFPTSTNRQENKEYYQFSGDIYASKISWLKKKKTFVSNKTLSYLMKDQISIDIDEPIDLEIARLLAEKK
jgi:CMP-N-acetylneuraminic acid synthetase